MKRIMVFMLGLLLGFKIVNSLLVPNWNYPMYAENEGIKLKSIVEKGNTDIDVFFLGTSHMEQGISPMVLYEKQKITGYNIATGSQPIVGTYYIVKEMFKRGYNPKLIVLDVSNLFLQSTNEEGYRLITNNLKIDENLFGMALEYSKIKDANVTMQGFMTDMGSFMIPLIKYHDRWATLNVSDFKSNRNKKYFMQGYFNRPTIEASLANQEGVELVASWMIQNQSSQLNDEKDLSDDEWYITEICDRNIYFIEKINLICKENGCSLLLTKIPVMTFASDYSSSWSLPRYECVKNLADQQGIIFWDLSFDANIDLDWNHDTQDGGRHLNLLGAEKVSTYIGEYIRENYDIPAQDNKSYENKLKLYREYSDIAHIEMSYNLVDYINKLKETDRELYVFISAKDDMISGLSEEEIAKLNELGLKTNFSNIQYGYSFIGVINSGISDFESASNRRLYYEISFANDTFEIFSAGYLDGNRSSILINGIEYSMNSRGINFVVYDKKSGLIIDRAVCDTFTDEHEVIHKSDDLLYGFSEYLLDN